MPDDSTVFTLLLSFFFLQSRLLLPEAMRRKKIDIPLPHSNARFSAELIVVAPRWFGVYRTRHRRLASRRWLCRMLCCIYERFLSLIALVIIVGQASSSSSSSLFVVVVIIVYVAEQWTGNGKGAAVFDEDCLLTLFESEKYTWTVERRPMPCPTRKRPLHVHVSMESQLMSIDVSTTPVHHCPTLRRNRNRAYMS
jgi:hypothetical protein